MNETLIHIGCNLSQMSIAYVKMPRGTKRRGKRKNVISSDDERWGVHSTKQKKSIYLHASAWVVVVSGCSCLVSVDSGTYGKKAKFCALGVLGLWVEKSAAVVGQAWEGIIFGAGGRNEWICASSHVVVVG